MVLLYICCYLLPSFDVPSGIFLGMKLFDRMKTYENQMAIHRPKKVVVNSCSFRKMTRHSEEFVQADVPGYILVVKNTFLDIELKVWPGAARMGFEKKANWRPQKNVVYVCFMLFLFLRYNLFYLLRFLLSWLLRVKARCVFFNEACLFASPALLANVNGW